MVGRQTHLLDKVAWGVPRWYPIINKTFNVSQSF